MSNDNLTKNSQYLSDLLDDRVTQQSVDRVLNDNDQAQAWYRYNLVRNVINKQHSAFSSYEFTQSISAKIADEPAMISRPRKQSPAVASFWKKAGGGMAIAASVAFAMVFSVQMMNSSNSTDDIHMQTADFSVDGLTPVDFTVTNTGDAEQAKLDEIQNILDRMNRRNMTENEQLVSGEVMVQSFVVKTKEPLISLEKQASDKHDPAEVVDKNKD